MADPVYKVLTETAFREAERQGYFTGSDDDVRDGFIHLSAGHQLEGTLVKFFAGQDGLVLVAVDPARLGAPLKWEPSRGGSPFPHLYAPLDPTAAGAVEPLPLGADGQHQFPVLAR